MNRTDTTNQRLSTNRTVLRQLNDGDRQTETRSQTRFGLPGANAACISC
jgi:hypothetical protein